MAVTIPSIEYHFVLSQTVAVYINISNLAHNICKKVINKPNFGHKIDTLDKKRIKLKIKTKDKEEDKTEHETHDKHYIYIYIYI